MTPFVEEQKDLEKEYRNRGKLLWPGIWGTMTLNNPGPKGKAAKKAAKRLTHTKKYYSTF